MRRQIALFAAISLFCLPAALTPRPRAGTVSGKVTFTGAPAKRETINMSKQPECVKMYPKPLTAEKVVTGPNNTLQNVVVYVTIGPADTTPVPSVPVTFNQQGCRYTTHVLAFRVGQEVTISNSDPFSHNIHPMPKYNREWNKIQLPGTPPFSYSYENEEFIPVKCNIHSWMQAYFVVLKTQHFAVTDEEGRFSLPDLPPGQYTLTAWHETYGTQTQEITVGEGQHPAVDFVFAAKP